jgi:hypothetical protein
MAIIESHTEAIPNTSVLKRISRNSTQLVYDYTPSKEYVVFRSGTNRRKPEGWLDPLDYSASYSTCDNGSGKWHAKHVAPDAFNVNEILHEGVIGAYANRTRAVDVLPVTTQMRNRAIIQALTNLKDQKVNLGQAFTERRMTANLLTSSVNRIARSVELLRRRKLKEAWKVLGGDPRQLPGSWLEYQYGWRPLMSDLYGSCEALADSQHRLHDWVVTVKGVAREKVVKQTFYPADGTPGAGWLDTVHKQGVFVRLDYHPGNAFKQALTSLGFTNPLQLMWEAVPYSFVVDWFLQVGDYLNVLDAAHGMQFKSGSRSERREVVARFKGGGATWASGNYKILADQYASRKRLVKLDRIKYDASPLPSLPTLGTGLNLTRFANGVSLLSQALGSGGPPGRRFF